MKSVASIEKKLFGLDKFDLFIVIAFSYNSVMVYFSAVFARLPIISFIGYQIIPIFVTLYAIVCLMNGYFRRVTVNDVLFILCFILTILISYIVHPETQKYYTESNMRSIYVEAIPFFILGLNFRLNQRTLKNLTYISYIAIIINFLYMFLYVGMTSGDGEYFMGQAYTLLPHVMFSINSIFDRTIIKRKFFPVAFSLIGLIFLVAMGTRGPLLIAVVYLAVKLFLSIDKKKPKVIAMVVILSIGVIWLIASGTYLGLLNRLSDIMLKFGMSTRVIDMLLSDQYLSNTSGRNDIYVLLLEKIAERPVFGYGIFGEEQFGVFAHNIVLEILLYYGIPIGGTIIIGYLTIVIKAYFKSTNKYAKDLILLFLIMTVVHAPFGGSHISYYVFFLLGISILEIRQTRCCHVVPYKMGARKLA